MVAVCRGAQILRQLTRAPVLRFWGPAGLFRAFLALPTRFCSPTVCFMLAASSVLRIFAVRLVVDRCLCGFFFVDATQHTEKPPEGSSSRRTRTSGSLDASFSVLLADMEAKNTWVSQWSFASALVA